YIARLKKELTIQKEIRNEIRIAKQIQENILPKKLPEDKCFKLVSFFQPAKLVSGDFFDAFLLNKDILVLIVGDVSGKGIPASFFMAVISTALRINCLEKNCLEPDRIFKIVNDFLLKSKDNTFFATVFMGFYYFKTGKFVYANAGHPEAALIKQNSNVELFGILGNTPLGMQSFADGDFIKGEYQLEKGDKLVLYTDGVTEAVCKDNKRDFFEEKGLIDSLKKNNTKSITEVVDGLYQNILEYQGKIQADDIAIIGLERLE
ncbi:MAG: PP2C family protein-serine/threonine phosphatase, partial [Candidatus Margulisiibacteriota bacterium]